MDIDHTRLPEPSEIRQCLYIRALEEADPIGERIPMSDRVAASNSSIAAADHPEGAFLRSRTAWLGARLKGPPAAGFARMGKEPSAVPGWIAVVVAVGAFLTGWLTHDLGADGRVSLLAFPLLGLIVWNVAVAAASLIPVKPGRVAGWPGLPAWLVKKSAPTGDLLTDEAVARSGREWQDLEAGRQVAQARQLFHLAALLLAAGVVAGMYARGLVKNYEAGWESTFLTQPAVGKLTRIVLGPASLLTGVPVPAVPPPVGLSPAAPWIHLWAASAALFILLPRVLLISMARRAAGRPRRHWAAGLAEYEANARRLAGGQPLVARILPVQGTPDSPLRDSLRALLQHLWGGQVMIDFLPSVAYGQEEESLAALTEPPTHLVLLLPMAVTPEAEVHGVLQRGLEKLLATAAPPPYALTVLDAAGFEARLAGMPEAARRMGERRAAWEKVLGHAWPLLVLDAAARRNPASAATTAAAARQPLRHWTTGS